MILSRIYGQYQFTWCYVGVLYKTAKDYKIVWKHVEISVLYNASCLKTNFIHKCISPIISSRKNPQSRNSNCKKDTAMLSSWFSRVYFHTSMILDLDKITIMHSYLWTKYTLFSSFASVIWTSLEYVWSSSFVHM